MVLHNGVDTEYLRKKPQQIKKQQYSLVVFQDLTKIEILIS